MLPAFFAVKLPHSTPLKRLVALLALVSHASLLLMAADPAPIHKIIVVSDSLTNDEPTTR